MEHAELYAVPLADAPGFGWKWRAANSQVEAEREFAYYFDCLTDALEHGYAVVPGRMRRSA